MIKSPSVRKKPRKERKDNADKRRQQLLDATLRSIATNGLTKTTLATVADEAGLSQGVAVFYFKTKTELLACTLKEHYRRYHSHWRDALRNAGEDPLDQLIALIKADFSQKVCNAQALSVWFAFWGEQKFTPQYASVSAEFDTDRSKVIVEICAKLVPSGKRLEAPSLAVWIETLTDGYWQRLHVSPKTMRRRDAELATLEMIANLLPEHSDEIRKRMF